MSKCFSEAHCTTGPFIKKVKERTHLKEDEYVQYMPKLKGHMLPYSHIKDKCKIFCKELQN